MGFVQLTKITTIELKRSRWLPQNLWRNFLNQMVFPFHVPGPITMKNSILRFLELTRLNRPNHPALQWHFSRDSQNLWSFRPPSDAWAAGTTHRRRSPNWSSSCTSTAASSTCLSSRKRRQTCKKPKIAIGLSINEPAKDSPRIVLDGHRVNNAAHLEAALLELHD